MASHKSTQAKISITSAQILRSIVSARAITRVPRNNKIKELEDLKEYFPEITLTTTPRPTDEHRLSSSSIREQLIRSFEDGDTNPYEITNMGEEELV